MESEGLLQHYVKTEVFTAYICNNTSSAIGRFMAVLPDPLLRQKNTFCFINHLSTKLYLSDLKTHFVPRSKHSLLRF